MVVKSDFTLSKLIFTIRYGRMGVSLHQLNQTDVVKRLHHLLLIQYILGKLIKNRVLREMRIRFFFLFITPCVYKALPMPHVGK